MHGSIDNFEMVLMGVILLLSAICLVDLVILIFRGGA